MEYNVLDSVLQEKYKYTVYSTSLIKKLCPIVCYCVYTCVTLLFPDCVYNGLLYISCCGYVA